MDEFWNWYAPVTAELIRLAPILTLVVGALAAGVALRTFILRSRLDVADEWWKRVQFALEKTTSADPDEAMMGTILLDNLKGEVDGPPDESRKDSRARRRSKKLQWQVQPRDLEMIRRLVAEISFTGDFVEATVDDEAGLEAEQAGG